VVDGGQPLGVAQIGALAAAGVAEVSCARRPRAAVLATGTELRPPGEELGPGQIYDANSTLLAAQLRSAGADVKHLQTVEDEEEAHRAELEAGVQADVLVTSGGVSVGPHDVVRSVGAGLGIEEVFWGVAVKPGKPIWFGVRGSTLVFGLPGNPVSSLVGFELFVRPALLALQRAAEPLPRFLPGRLARPVRQNAARTELVRARSVIEGSDVRLDVLGGQESHMIATAAGADALVLIPAGTEELPSGAPVSYLPLA
jgi:molybdopterin molybdotransferase